MITYRLSNKGHLVKSLLLILVLNLLLAAAAVSGGYQWVDENGVKHYSDIGDFPDHLTVEPTLKGVSSERLYYTGVQQLIIQNWKPDFKSRPDQEVVVGIIILPSGKIQSVLIEKQSGNKLLDKAAVDTVWKANPLPPFPTSIKRDTLSLGIRFSGQPNSTQP